MRSTLRNFAFIAVVAGSPGVLADSSTDPGFGSWKLNEHKSTFRPGPAPKGLTTTFEAAGTGVKWVSRRIGPDGSVMVAEYTGHYDGKDYPVTGSPTTDSVTLRRIDARTTERVNKKDGKVVSTERREVAPDGRSYTTTVTGTTAKGEPINTRMVFDRQ